MKPLFKTLIGVCVCCVMVVANAGAAPTDSRQEQADPSLLLLLDSSGSMNADDGSGRKKIATAKRALVRLVRTLPDDANVGLRVYGHRYPNTDKRRGCRDTELITPVGPLDTTGMIASIGRFQSRGFTPIGASLRAAVRDLPADGERTIVLVSDGVDTCTPPSACDVAREASRSGVRFSVEAIGFQVDATARRELQCIARVSRGSYRDANDASALSDELATLSSRALRTYETIGKPVVGGSAATTAPIVADGQYTTTIPGGRPQWFAVNLGPRQKMNVVVTIPATKGLGLSEVTVYDPQLDQDSSDLGSSSGETFTMSASSDEVVGDPGSTDGNQPGKHYFEVSLPGGNTAPEFKAEMAVTVTTRSAPDTQNPISSGGVNAVVADDDSVILKALLAAVIGIALGVAAAAILTRRKDHA